MSIGQKGAVDRQLRTLFQTGVSGASTDGELIGQFVNGSERAFETLLERHGPMVFRVCRSVLHHEQDAQDAFQAVFVILARRARSLWVRDSIGPWLHGVAYRVAIRARTAQTRRQEHERRKAVMQSDRVVEGDTGEIALILHEEIERLPVLYRAAIILSDIQGLPLEQAARRLGCPVGTLKSRLSRGRDRLRNRLERRGMAPNGVGCLPIVPGLGTWPSYVLTELTTTVALRAAAGPLAGVLSPSVLSLASGVLRMMHLQRGLLGLIASVTIALMGFGLSARTGLVRADDRPAPPASHRPVGNADVPMPMNTQFAFDVMVLNAPDLSFRKTGVNFDFEKNHGAELAFLSDLEASLLLEQLLSISGANGMQSPRVTPFRLNRPLEFSFPFADETLGPEGGMAWPAKVVLKAPDHDQTRENLPVPDQAQPQNLAAEGGNITITGDLSEDERHLALNIKIEDNHTVEVHRAELPGRDLPLEVPEVIHRDVDERVTIPASGGHILFSLGLYRTVDERGKATILERLVLIGVRRIELADVIQRRR